MVILPKNVTGDLWKVSLGHPRSPVRVLGQVLAIVWCKKLEQVQVRSRSYDVIRGTASGAISEKRTNHYFANSGHLSGNMEQY